jgi:hypothetical protein
MGEAHHPALGIEDIVCAPRERSADVAHKVVRRERGVRLGRVVEQVCERNERDGVVQVDEERAGRDK